MSYVGAHALTTLNRVGGNKSIQSQIKYNFHFYFFDSTVLLL